MIVRLQHLVLVKVLGDTCACEGGVVVRHRTLTESCVAGHSDTDVKSAHLFLHRLLYRINRMNLFWCVVVPFPMTSGKS